MYKEKVEMNIPRAKIKIMLYKFENKGVLDRIHMHPEIELLYIKKGTIIYHTKNTSLQVNNGEIVFSNSHTAHYIESLEDNMECVGIFFQKPDNCFASTKYLMDFLYKNSCPYHIFKSADDDNNALFSILDNMLYEYNHKLKARDYAILAKKYEIITILFRKEFIEEENDLLNKNIKPILPILNYIEQNYQNPISLQNISNETALHKNYVCSLFKSITNKTISDYISFVRICEAKELLKLDIPLSEIAYKVGFSSQSYFNKVFKKYLFYTPLEYKKINENVPF